MEKPQVSKFRSSKSELHILWDVLYSTISLAHDIHSGSLHIIRWSKLWAWNKLAFDDCQWYIDV